MLEYPGFRGYYLRRLSVNDFKNRPNRRIFGALRNMDEPFIDEFSVLQFLENEGLAYMEVGTHLAVLSALSWKLDHKGTPLKTLDGWPDEKYHGGTHDQLERIIREAVPNKVPGPALLDAIDFCEDVEEQSIRWGWRMLLLLYKKLTVLAERGGAYKNVNLDRRCRNLYNRWKTA